MFVNLIALVMHYRIYGILMKVDLLSFYSLEEVIKHLECIHMLRIWDQWKLSEVPKKSRIIGSSNFHTGKNLTFIWFSYKFGFP